MPAFSSYFLSAVLLVLVVDKTNFGASLGVEGAPISRPRIGIVIQQNATNNSLDQSARSKATIGPLVGVKTDGIRSDLGSKQLATSKAFQTIQTAGHSNARSLKLTKVALRHNEDDHALLILQRQLNRANSKLASMRGYRAPSPLEMETAMLNRRRSVSQRRSYLRTQLGSSAQQGVSARSSAVLPLAVRKVGKHGRLGIKVVHKRTYFRRLIDGLLGGVLGGDATETSSTPAPSVPFSSPDTSSVASSANISNGAGSSAPFSANHKSSAQSPFQSDVTLAPEAGYPTLNLDAATDGELTMAREPSASHTLGLDIEANDVGYIATVQIGSNSQNFRLLIDSGSADTWVAGASCTRCGNSHQRLGEASTSFKGTTHNFSVTYGTGAVSGTMASDDVKIAGMELPNHPVGLASDETRDFSDNSVPFDGLMGLAKSELSNSQVPTPIDALFSAGLVVAPVMGYHLARVADGRNGSSHGEVTFGGVDSTRFQGEMLEIPNVSDQGFWEAQMSAIMFGGQDLGLSNRTAILDTGTTLILAPQADADALHAAIPGSRPDGQGGYYIPCTVSKSDGSGPTLSLSFDGTAFPIDTRDLTFLPLDQSDLQGECVSAISAGSVGQANEWLVGAAFLKNVYFATNSKLDVIGLAPLAGER